MKRHSLYSLILIVLLLAACSPAKRRAKEAINSLLGKELIVSMDSAYIIADKVEWDYRKADYKIITYLDSSECTGCHMHLKEWTALVDQLNNYNTEVSFLMIVDGKTKTDVKEILKGHNFMHPVIIDSTQTFLKDNNLPSEEAYHTFLLDADNKIVALGNPVLNPKMAKVYKSALEEKVGEMSSEMCLASKKSYGVVNYGDSVSVSFNLINNSDSLLTIEQIVTSCDCITATASDNTLTPKATTDIFVVFKPSSVSGFIERSVSVFFNEKENSQKLTIYGIVQ